MNLPAHPRRAFEHEFHDVPGAQIRLARIKKNISLGLPAAQNPGMEPHLPASDVLEPGHHPQRVLSPVHVVRHVQALPIRVVPEMSAQHLYPLDQHPRSAPVKHRHRFPRATRGCGHLHGDFLRACRKAHHIRHPNHS